MSHAPIKVTDNDGNKLIEGIDYTVERNVFTPLIHKAMNITWYSENKLTFNRAQRKHPDKGTNPAFLYK